MFRPICRVNFFASRKTSIGQSILFQEPIAHRIAIDAKAGLVIGIIMRTDAVLAAAVNPGCIKKLSWKRHHVLTEEKDGGGGAQAGKDDAGVRVDQFHPGHFLVQGEHQDLEGDAHGSDDEKKQESPQLKVVHRQTIGNEITDKQRQDDGCDRQNQGILIPQEILCGINLAVPAANPNRYL